MSRDPRRDTANTSAHSPPIGPLFVGGLLLLCGGLGLTASAMLAQGEQPLLALSHLAAGEARPERALSLSVSWLIRWSVPCLGLAWLGQLGAGYINKRQQGARHAPARDLGLGSHTIPRPEPGASLAVALVAASGCAFLLPGLMASGTSGATHAANGLLRFLALAWGLVALGSFTFAGLLRAARGTHAPPQRESSPGLKLARLRRGRANAAAPRPQDQRHQAPQQTEGRP